MYYPKSEYKFVKFRKSETPFKKYDAIIKKKSTGELKRIPFGQQGYDQYKDKTGLGLYSSYDHGSMIRRNSYRARHIANVRNDQFSPGYFSYFYLW